MPDVSSRSPSVPALSPANPGAADEVVRVRRWALHFWRRRWWYILGSLAAGIVSTLGGLTTLGLDVPQLYARYFGGSEESKLRVEYSLPPAQTYTPLEELVGALPVGEARLNVEYSGDPVAHFAFLLLRPDGSADAWLAEELIERSFARWIDGGALRVSWIAENAGAESLFILESSEPYDDLSGLCARIAALELQPAVPPSLQVEWMDGEARFVASGSSPRDFGDVREYSGDEEDAWVGALSELFADLEDLEVWGRTYSVADKR